MTVGALYHFVYMDCVVINQRMRRRKPELLEVEAQLHFISERKQSIAD